MIENIEGNLFTCGAGILCHQVNCMGSMGAGIAAQVQKYMSREDKQMYKFLCSKHGGDLLGEIMLTYHDKFIIAHCFAQVKYGTNRKQTNYGALYSCMEKVLDIAIKKNVFEVAVPKYIGCGLAGGDWNKVYNKILVPIFDNAPVTLKVVSLYSN